MDEDQIEESDHPLPEAHVPTAPEPMVHVPMPNVTADVPPWTPLSASVSGPKFLSLSTENQGKIRKLHRNLGHPTADKLARHLAEQNVLPELVDGARDYQCESCAERRPPQKTTPGNLKDAVEFNEKVSTDGCDWKSQSGLTVYVLHILDDATRFHLGQRTQRDSQLLTKTFKTMWINWAGVPSQVLHDQGGEFITDEWKNFLQENGIQPILTAAPWQRGRIERHGGVIKEMLNRMDQENPITDLKHFDEALYQCFHAKNTMSIVSGHSPEQAVLGRASKLPASVLSDEDLASHLTCDGQDLASKQFQRKLELRAAARSAFSKADNSAAIRRALSHQSRGVIHSWSCGQ
eukprot:s308_g55.t1